MPARPTATAMQRDDPRPAEDEDDEQRRDEERSADRPLPERGRGAAGAVVVVSARTVGSVGRTRASASSKASAPKSGQRSSVE